MSARHRTAALAAALAAALGLGACAPLPRAVPDNAAVALPDTWSETATGATAELPSDWWRQLGDARLDALVQEALAHNNDLLTALARVDEARANWAGTDAARRPTLSATAGAQAGRSLSALGPSQTQSVQPGLQASWELDLWGRLSQQSQAAGQRLQASQADRDAVALTVAAATVQTYVDLRSLQEQLRIAQATVQSREKALALAQDQQRVGYTSQLQLTQAEAELYAVQQQVQQLDLAVQRQGNALNLLLGRAGGRIPDGAALQDLHLPPVPASLPSQLLERRPDIARAAHLLGAADHTLQAQRAAFMPQVTLSASAGSLLINALNYNPLTVWSLGGSLLAPLFDGGRREAALDAATAQRDQAAYAYRGAVLAAFADVENALTGNERLARQMQQAVQRRDVLQRSLGFAHDRYEAGYASYLEELDAQRNLFQAELTVATLRQAELDNRVQLYKALGGGWRAEDAEVAKQ
ncbi:MAG: efflux transporter outer membrane subunit [Proteobacteria bacterium]|nr:efflux transporter outer membrane subunit [Pseudomonadota bacterium]MBS0495171.1 efflux transporter outer membrane subunit [Pseudomonadota bacterium]